MSNFLYCPQAYPAIPQIVTMRQARRALLGIGKLAEVNTAIASMPGAMGDAARVDWEFARDVIRTDALVLAMGTFLGLDDAWLDALFVSAAKL
jgi:hypothetical protein